MKNIANVMKYSFKSLKILYFIELIIVLLGLFTGRFIAIFTGGWDIVAIVATLGTVNFIAHIILFSNQLSKEYGRLLFLTPIRGIEFIIGNLLELISVNIVFISITIIINIINIGSVNNEMLVSMVESMWLIVAYLIITSLIVIFSSYIRNTFLVIIMVVFASIIGNEIYEAISSRILVWLPYVYMTIGKSNIIEIDIISLILGLAVLILLQIVAASHIDKKIDII